MEETIAFSFELNEEDLKKGFRDHDRATKQTVKTVVQCVALGILCGIYLIDAIRLKSWWNACIGLAVTVIIIGVWLLPKKTQKQAIESLQEENLRFDFTVKEHGFQFGQEYLPFDRGYHLYSFPENYLFSLGRDRVLILPKSKIPEEEKETLEQLFRDKLGDRFSVGTEKVRKTR